MSELKPARIITVSGPQGCGKGSMIGEIERIDFDHALNSFMIDDFKVSRSVQKELGFKSLSQVYSSLENVILFQNLVLDTKYRSLRSQLETVGRDFIITERSFLDIAAYFELWCEKQLILGNLTEEGFFDITQSYFQRCYEYQRELCEISIIIPMMDHVKFEEDSQRASEQDIDRFYELLMKHVAISETECFFVTKQTVYDRARQVIDFLIGE